MPPPFGPCFDFGPALERMSVPAGLDGRAIQLGGEQAVDPLAA